jgi:hypothetical protein
MAHGLFVEFARSLTLYSSDWSCQRFQLLLGRPYCVSPHPRRRLQLNQQLRDTETFPKDSKLLSHRCSRIYVALTTIRGQHYCRAVS